MLGLLRDYLDGYSVVLEMFHTVRAVGVAETSGVTAYTVADVV